jgi:hypothetical protein
MRNAFLLLTTQQQFASGGWGPNETFLTPHRGELYNSLSTTVDHFETPCGSYAATKLARYLLRTTPIRVSASNTRTISSESSTTQSWPHACPMRTATISTIPPIRR